MSKSNYALITALYVNNMNKGLYSDIYFPIIKYALLKIFSNRKDEHPYSDASVVEDFIKEHFGIVIPTIVIANAVQKICNNSASSIVLQVFEDGNEFQIQQVKRDDTINIDKEEKEFEGKEQVIEKEFRSFIEREGINDDNITFVEFISSNTDALLEYLNTENEKQVEEKYYSLIPFFKFLHNNNLELYQTANKFFWGSIIAAFLQSDKPSVNASEDEEPIEYYLDTPLVMGILDLSTPEKEHYSKELKETIIASKGILRVHPITLEEIKSILLSVEQHGVNPFSDIASAKERRKLNVPSIARIRVNLEKLVETAGISISPAISSREIESIKTKYKGNVKVKALAKQRSHGIESYTKDGFREVHDIFMDDFIKTKRVAKKDEKHTFFVTNNIDLINTCKGFHSEDNRMVSISRLILDLWMYNTKATDVSDVALVEAMAKCIDAHKIDVKNKIAIVSKYYNQTKGNYDPKVYNDFVRQLYRRAKNVIKFVDSSKNLESEDYTTWSDGFIKAVSSDVDAEMELRNHLEKEKANLKDEVNQKEQSLKNSTEDVNKLTEEKTQLVQAKDELKKKNTQLSDDKKKLQSDIKSLTNETGNLKKEILELRKTIELKDKLSRLNKQLTEKEEELAALEAKREKSYANWPSIIFAILFLACIVVIILNITNVIDLKEISVVGALGVVFLTTCVTFYKEPNIGKLQDKAYEKWEEKPENQMYGILKNKIEEIQEEINKTKEGISNYKDYENN